MLLPHTTPAAELERWRRERLEGAGFDPQLAADLARGHSDLHALLELRDRGCPPDLAARILAPDDPA
ncbi:MAG: hypothetical protein QOH58_3250 [Thermoleophilaceae bacterium]|nr:hypothetical protein [Thermoleophilaceae bacterium]